MMMKVLFKDPNRRKSHQTLVLKQILHWERKDQKQPVERLHWRKFRRADKNCRPSLM